MSRLIDADALKSYMDECSKESKFRVYYAYAESFINYAPTIDAVPVVRCRECKHSDAECHKDGLRYCMRGIRGDDYNETGYVYPLEVVIRDDDFCSYGKRKGGDD